jgi:hypothetical protein
MVPTSLDRELGYRTAVEQSLALESSTLDQRKEWGI